MKGSAHIATLWGIPVKIHWTFGLMLLYVAFTSSRDGFNPFLVLLMIGFVLSIFLCVVLHEFGHALMARRFGVKTFDIIMTPIGGIARLERMPVERIDVGSWLSKGQVQNKELVSKKTSWFISVLQGYAVLLFRRHGLRVHRRAG